jgi:peptidoglycan hydrolase CwlO-like protein
MPKKLIISMAVSIALGAIVLSSRQAWAVTCDSNIDGKSDQELQAISDQCDKDIAAQQAILGETQKQSASLAKGIAELTARINESKLKIKGNTAKIKQLGASIVVKTTYIGQLSERMGNIKESMAKMLRNNYEIDQISTLEVFLSSKNLSDFFKDVDDYASINVKLRELDQELTGVKTDTEKAKKDLETKKTQEEKLKFEQEAAKKQSENLQKEKQSVLTITKGQEAAYQKVIGELERNKNKIRNRLFRTVGGEELTFGEALKVIQPYESTVGVSSALVLAVLTQESSVDSLIGKNIGKCYYNQSASNSANSVMSPSQIPSFLAIMSEVGLNPNTTPVSCPIYSDGSYGGAMGPAQFMPKTWWDISTGLGYKNRVGDVIGSTLPSPFNNKEAFVGTALYLKDAQTRCKTAYSKISDIWACSAAKYYGGLTLKGSKLYSFMYGTYGYGHQVAIRAAQFQKDIDTLNL